MLNVAYFKLLTVWQVEEDCDSEEDGHDTFCQNEPGVKRSAVAHMYQPGSDLPLPTRKASCGHAIESKRDKATYDCTEVAEHCY